MDWLQINVVYVNEIIYKSFFSYNSNLLRYHVHAVDNRGLNKGLSAIYNDIIEDNIDRDIWLFFVHEDYEIKGDLEHISALSKDHVYGSFGTRMSDCLPLSFGLHTCSNKDGSEAVNVGYRVFDSEEVDVLDCQAMLVHTSLFRNFPKLRFDENLTFDLYAEDFCLNASSMHGLKVKVFPLQFQHYSHGKVTQRYYDGLDYLAKKYPDVGVAGPCSFIGGNTKELEKKYTYQIKALE